VIAALGAAGLIEKLNGREGTTPAKVAHPSRMGQPMRRRPD
jgi:hypothetical protein